MTAFGVAWIRLLAIGALVVLCAAPILYGYRGILDDPDALRVLTASSTVDRLIRSMVCSSLIALSASAVGIPLGLSWAASRGGMHAALALLTVVPFILPPYIYALAWIELVGAARAMAPIGAAPVISIYSLAGVVIVESLRLVPVAAGASWLAARSCDRSMLEASLMTRGRYATFTRVLLPTRAPLFLAAPLLAFILAFSNPATASLLQVDLYPIDIQTQFNAHYDSARAFTLTIPMVLLGSAAALIGFLLYRSQDEADSVQWSAANPIGLVPRRLAFGLATLFVALAVVAPLAIVAIRAASLRALLEAARGLSSELFLAMAIAAISAGCALVLAVALVPMRRFRVLAFGVAALPLLVTGSAFGIGLILLWNHPGWRGAVYDSTAVLVAAETARVLIVALTAAVIGFAAQPRDLHAAAELAGRSRASRFVSIALPLAAPALLLGTALALLIAFADADTAALVAPPGATPLAVRIAGLLHYGPSDFLHAASVVSATVALVLAAAAGFGIRATLARVS